MSLAALSFGSANTEALYVNVYLANPYANALIECIPHRVDQAVGNRCDPRAVFDNHIHINDDLAVFLAHLDAPVGVARETGGDVGSQVRGCHTHDAIGLQDRMARKRSDGGR